MTSTVLPMVSSRAATATEAACRHCGTALAAGQDGFCCGGCAGAYTLVQKLGLGNYYVRRVLDRSVAPPRPDGLPAVDFRLYVRDLGNGRSALDLALDGLHCAACVWLVETLLGQQADMRQARINATTRRLALAWEGPPARANELAALVASLGYRVMPWAAGTSDPGTTAEESRLLRSLAVAGFAAGNIMLLSVGIWAGADGDMGSATRDLLHWISALIALPAIAYAGQPFFRSAWSALRHGRTNMDVPISIGVTIAAALSLFETAVSGEHAYFDSATTLLFFLLIGRYLDRHARGKARAAVDHLLALRSRTVTVIDDAGQSSLRPAASVSVNERVLVAAGERIGVDGVVTAGASAIDTSLVTGESAPQHVQAGDMLFAGMINLGAPLTLKVTATDERTLLAEMTRLLAAAEQARGRFTALADRVARYYAPVVHVTALATFVGWLMLAAGWHSALLNAVSVLIITCPCALALAVPAVQVVATGRLLRDGILVKSPTALERFARIDTVVFDKTGTLTLGQPVLTQCSGSAADIQAAAALAATSKHPLARALVRAAGPAAPVEGSVEQPGAGIAAGDKRLGSRAFCGIDGRAEGSASELWFTAAGRPPVQFRFADQLRPDAETTIARLRGLGLRLVLLSGDHAPAVQDTADALGIIDWQAGVSPRSKIEKISALRAAGHCVLMVGDGINDAPALAAADASLSPASASDVAQATADAVFQGQKLLPVLTAVQVARRAAWLIRENLGIALGYNFIAVPLAIAGMVTPLIAAAAMSGSSLLVIGNALRAGTRESRS